MRGVLGRCLLGADFSGPMKSLEYLYLIPGSLISYTHTHVGRQINHVNQVYNTVRLLMNKLASFQLR